MECNRLVLWGNGSFYSQDYMCFSGHGVPLHPAVETSYYDASVMLMKWRCVGPCTLKKMHSSCLLFFSVAGLLFTVSFATIVSMYANVTESYFTTASNFIVSSHHLSSFRIILMWRLSVISTGGGISHFTVVCLFSLVSFFCADYLFFLTRVGARLLRGKTCRGVTYIIIRQIS